MTDFHNVDYTIEALHLDRFGRVKPAIYLYFAQEAAESHCKELGTDWETMSRKGLFWAVIRQRLEILRQPVSGQTIHVHTWPMPTTRTCYPRATEGVDRDGNVVFRIVSMWVLMDVNTRAMVLPGKSGVTVDGWLRGSELPLPPSMPVFPYQGQWDRVVLFSDLDRNGHMNNARYIDWILDLQASDYLQDHPVTAVTLHYHAEALEGDPLSLCFAMEEGICLVDAHGGKTHALTNSTRTFSARMEF